MQAYICKVFIDNNPYLFKVEGDFFYGKKKCLYNSESSIIGNAYWEKEGYVIQNLLTDSQFSILRDSITSTLIRIISDLGINFNKDIFNIEDYHLFISSNEAHQSVVERTSKLVEDNFDFDFSILTNNLSQIMDFRLTSLIKDINRSHIQLRINRPKSLDINPPHRDGYIDIFKDTLNVWVPIAGCNENTSLPIIPFSHFIPENELLKTSIRGATINNKVYNVPCILESNKGNLKMIRPNPKYNEALLFTPFLIHGAAFNNSKKTRIALELRFPRDTYI